jgi:hypothetical protein
MLLITNFLELRVEAESWQVANMPSSYRRDTATNLP